uniref:CW domain-containing protein n=1 Tax=Caenorhabditis tropicalis TaxID=1561998 RepID=A0A1I7U2E4_9PELO
MKYVDYDYDPTKNCDRSFKPFTELVNGEWRILEEGKDCSARCFYTIDDMHVNHSKWMQPGPVDCEFLEAVCWEGEKEIYGYIHTQIIPK